ncbi:hypothetical protein EMIT0P294_10909 [Pseudomonas sp. IT-P294]
MLSNILVNYCPVSGLSKSAYKFFYFGWR